MVINGLTYDSVNKRLTLAYVASDLTRGGTALNPYVVQDIYDTCIANGWDVMDKRGSTYIFDEAALYVGGNTYFDISNSTLIFNDALGEYYFYCNTAGAITGNDFEILNNNNKWCTIYGANNGLSILTKGYIKMTLFCHLGYTKFENSRFIGMSNIDEEAGVSLINCTATLGTTGVVLRSGSVNDGLILIDSASNFRIRELPVGAGVELRNITIVGDGEHLYYRLDMYDNELAIIDCNINPESYIVYQTNGYNCTTQFITTFRWKFDADVKVYDKDENLIIDKTVSMNDENEVIFCEHHLLTGGQTADVEVRYKQPFKVVVSKKGFETIAISGIEVVLGQKTIIRAELKKAIEVMATNKGIAIKANKTNYGKNRDFAIIP